MLLLKRAGGATRESVGPRRYWLRRLQMEQAGGQGIPLYLISLSRTEKDAIPVAGPRETQGER